MTRILMRGGKDPFHAVSPYETLDRDLIGQNSGNLIFAAASHKLLSAKDVSISVNGYSFDPKRADEVSSEYDHVVIPFANAFRAGYGSQLRRAAEFVGKLKIPAVMLSGGAQSGPDGTFEVLKSIEPDAKALVSALLDRSSHITVRGERTADYIKSLGFRDVLVIGCPSMTMNGPGHRVRKVVLDRDLYRVAYNIQASKDLAGPLVADIEAKAESTYIPQDWATLEQMLWATEHFLPTRDYRLPLRMEHKQFLNNRARFMVDASTWINYMREMDLSVGPRIHGNVAGVLAGTPSVVLTHDSRTEELCRYHEIPYFSPEEVDKVSSLEQVLDRADYTSFNAGHTERFDRVVDFLHLNGLQTIYDTDQVSTRASYEARIEGTAFPSAVEVAWARKTELEVDRLRWLRQRDLAQSKRIGELSKIIASLRRTIRDASKIMSI